MYLNVAVSGGFIAADKLLGPVDELVGAAVAFNKAGKVRKAAKRAKSGAKRARPDLPILDKSGKVHGALPRAQDFDEYTPEELLQLHRELTSSVYERIMKTIEMGSHRNHGQRLSQEQQLIKQIEKYLGD